MATEPELSAAALATLETIAQDIAREAGRLIVDERPTGLGVAETKSSPVDVVTVMDHRSEELLRSRIQERRPDDGVLGEEGDTTVGTSGITWVVDPIDGTVNYLYGIPAYAVSVAACVGDTTTEGAWRAVAGAVYHPVLDEMFHARVGAGAFLRTPGGVTVLDVSRPESLAQSLLGTGFGYDAEKRGRQGAVVARLLPQVRDIRRAGSAALDLCSVAAGRLDVYYESGLNPWDLAAGELIVREAGGRVVGVDGGVATSQLVVAGSSSIVDELLPLL